MKSEPTVPSPNAVTPPPSKKRVVLRTKVQAGGVYFLGTNLASK